MTDKQRNEQTGLIPPIQPTGSGVADLEIAREQDALAAGDVAGEGDPVVDQAFGDVTASGAE